jgi:hypothetical protein
MAKPEVYSNPLIPLVLVAGLLSGSLWRSTPPADAGKPGDTGSSRGAETSNGGSAPAPWISDLRPALESLDAALGAHADSAGPQPVTQTTGIALAPKGDARDQQIFDAMAGLRSGLDRLSSRVAVPPCGNAGALEEPARVLGAWLLADGGDGATARVTEARALLDEYRDWRLLVDLAKRVRHSRNGGGHPIYSVGFIVATLPDYVDSNSGWLADQGLAAMQSGMAQEQYLFDRVTLIDWARAAGGAAPAPSASHLHERQPGVIIFRHVTGQTISLEAVLTVPETPTAGIHQVALRNSLWFLRAWNACSGTADASLRVLGPSFSGSTLSLALVLGEAPFARAFARRVVISGSATADENVETMDTFSKGAIFRATVQPTSVLKALMAAYLRSINATWKDDNLALLIESNTAYGGVAGSRRSTSAVRTDAFAQAKIFNFPLHIAQLRSDAPRDQPGAALMPASAIPLNMHETAPPSDSIPVLRPQLTSPIVEATVHSILDEIRHQRIPAVGIQATDDRDVLFLAREVKRAAPDVQLFLFGTHALYLHPDYLPYLRGALVASSYALTLANQPEIPDTSKHDSQRHSFQSMVSEGVFYATRALVSLRDDASHDAVPYCDARGSKPCVPVAPASINVVGEGGYWTLAGAQNLKVETTRPAGPDRLRSSVVPAPAPLNVAPLPPIPTLFSIGAVLVLAIVAGHLWMLIRISRAFKDPSIDRSFFEWPLVGVLVPPRTFNRAAGLHRFAVSVCFALLSLAAAWVVAIALPFLLPASAGPIVPCAAVATCIAVIYTGVVSYGPRRSLPDALPVGERQEASAPGIASRFGKLTMTEWAGWLLFAGMVTTMCLFVALVIETALDAINGGPGRLTIARMVGGGIVSPAALTLFLAAAFYTAVFTGVRRLSLVGFGYARLGGGSPAFGLLTAEPEPAVGDAKQGSLAGILDMPAQNMPSVYPVALLLALSIAAVCAGRVTTIEGRTFSWFVTAGTWTTLGLGLLQLAQGLALWSTARPHLKRLAQTPIEKHLQKVAPHVPWEISLEPPRLTELMPVARMADSVMCDCRRLVFSGRAGSADDPMSDDPDGVRIGVERCLGLRPGDLASLKPLFAVPAHVSALETEMALREHAAIIQSESWFGLWRLSDSLVTLLQRSVWRRCTTAAPAQAGRQELAMITSRPGLPMAPMEVAGPTLGPDIEPPDVPCATGKATAWFARCEQLVALQIAFVLRDIVARTITCLFAAMLCLTSLSVAHLLYVFSGRASLLTIDMLAVAATAVLAVWILVDMERDHVLSRLRTTTPGRVDVNWEFIKRIAVYGVLPLLAVIASLFPEVGGTLFGWLEPLRKLSTF